MSHELSQEAIAPQYDRRFAESLTKALQSVYDTILAQSPTEGADPILRGLKRLKSRDREKLMTPIKDVIEKHIGVEVQGVYLTTNARPIAVVSSSAFRLLDRKGPTDVIKSQALKAHPDRYYDYLKQYQSLCQHTDQKAGVLSKDYHGEHPIVYFTFPGEWFSEIHAGRIPTEHFVGIILHEVGHVVDGLQNAWRMYHSSILAEEILSYQADEPDDKHLHDLLVLNLDLVTKMTQIDPHTRPYLIRDLKALIKSPAISTEAERVQYRQAAISLLEICAGQISVSIGKRSDIADTEDRYRSSERTADRYSVMQGQAYRSEDMWYQSLYLALSRGHANAEKILKKGLLRPQGPEGKYDDFFERALRLLRERYALFRDIEDQDPRRIKALLAETQDAEHRLETLRKDVKAETWLWDILKGISRYGYLVVTLPFLRDRFAQDSAIHDQLHGLTHNPLHYHGQSLRHDTE